MSAYSNEEIIPSTEIEASSREETEQTNTDEIITEETLTLQVTESSSKFDPIKRIRKGFNYFKDNEYNKYPSYYRKLAENQEPKFLMFACSDSRVCPSNILNLRPGEAFITRNIANMVPAFDQLKYSGVGAVIEYAVLALKVKVIMVIGHSRCGGINRLMSLPDKRTSYDFIDDWVKIGLPAKAKVLREHPNESSDEKLQALCEKEAVNNSLMNLLTYPYVRVGVANNKIKLLGGYYNFVRGKFEVTEFDFEVKPTIQI